MNKRTVEAFLTAGGRIEDKNGTFCTFTDERFDPNLFARLVAQECALIAGLMEHEGRKMIGAQILDSFNIKFDYTEYALEVAGSIHSDKKYSIGTPEEQEAFDIKRGYKL